MAAANPLAMGVNVLVNFVGSKKDKRVLTPSAFSFGVSCNIFFGVVLFFPVLFSLSASKLLSYSSDVLKNISAPVTLSPPITLTSR